MSDSGVVGEVLLGETLVTNLVGFFFPEAFEMSLISICLISFTCLVISLYIVMLMISNTLNKGTGYFKRFKFGKK